MSTRPLVFVLPRGGYSTHADHEAEPVAEWLTSIGGDAELLRYPRENLLPVPCSNQSVPTASPGRLPFFLILGAGGNPHVEFQEH